MRGRDPMESYEQAEIEADERFYEDRDDGYDPNDDPEYDGPKDSDPSWAEGRVDNN
jgi:hypothetical protein